MPRVYESSVATAAPQNGALDWISPQACLAGTGHGRIAWHGEDLKARVQQLAARLLDHLPAGVVVGSLADNSPHWLVTDLALHAAGMVHVPLPEFFTSEQTAHTVDACAMEALVCSDARLAARIGFASTAMHAGPLGYHLRREAGAQSRAIDRGAALAKITFTSGTTGKPKGVMLTFEQQLAAARSLAAVTARLGIERHLCLLPLPVLLENVAGAYTALLIGATCICAGLDEVGMQGASGFDPYRCLDLVTEHKADSLILLPQMLSALVAVLEADAGRQSALTGLKFVAVGGARTSAALILRARRLGLPVYEGYGLSECGSVVSLNLPHADQPGSVGRALPGAEIRLAPDGRVQVRGRCCAGYLGSRAPAPDTWFSTGDLGTMDGAGYLRIVGRKKNVLVTSYGRNVSPEWPEALLAEQPGIAQSVVFGDARPFLVTVVCTDRLLTDAEVETRLATVNVHLPDYARIGGWVRAREAFTPANGLVTANGRARRDAVYARYAADIDAIYGTSADSDAARFALVGT